jgi:beta-glucanase (GH16 family)
MGGTGGTTGAGGAQTTGGGGGAGGSGGSGTGGAGGAGKDGGTGCLPGVIGHPDCSQPAPPTYPNFTLYLDEEFSAPIDLVNDPVWTYSDGGQPEGDQRFVKDAITFTGGNMVITATARNVPGSKSCSELLPNVPNSSTVPNKPHASGEFRTKYNNFRYGRYETSFESPQGQPAGPGGCVPGATASTVCSNFLTTFFIFRTPKSKGPNGGGQWREIDIEIEGDQPTSLGTNLVTQDNNPNGGYDASRAEVFFSYPQGGNGAMALPTGFNVRQAGFHTYAFEWTPMSIRWFVDGVLVRVKTSGTGLPIPAESAHIMANLWFFPSNAAFGNPNLNQYPMTSRYNYIRFYRWNQDTTYPKANPAAELPAGDLGTRNNAEDGLGACP